MHELSIALSILDGAAEEAAKLGNRRVVGIQVRIGALSGVIADALLSAFDMACEGHALQDARLLIEEVPVVAWCPACAAERPVESIQNIVCATCGTPTPTILRGREMEIAALEIESDL